MNKKPMLATLVDKPFSDPAWVYETKWDGFRILAEIRGGRVRLWSRNGKDETKKYPQVARALAKVRGTALIDGELCAFDAKGRSRFQLLQNAQNTEVPLAYCAFDLPYVGARDLRKLPLLERKKLLARLLPKSKLLRFSRHTRGNGVAAFRAAKKRGLEGVMAKRADSPYRSGLRSRDWLKFKAVHEQEAVIVGYTPPRGARKHFGALVLAVRAGSKWRYAGRAGTGFDEATLASLAGKMRPLKARKPFAKKVPEERLTTWLTPRLVCEIKFTEWTKGGEMRHPVFLGLRADKPARLVVREG